MPETTPAAATTAAPTTTTTTADDVSMFTKADEVLQRPVWHFVTIGAIAAGVVGFFLGRLSKKSK